MIYEIYLPVADPSGTKYEPRLFRQAFDELAEQLGFVETWPVYRPLAETEHDVSESEWYRFQFEASDTADNRRWLVRWRQRKSAEFAADLWMIRYRLP